MKTSIKEKNKPLKEHDLVVGQLYEFEYSGKTRVICLVTESKNAVVLHVEKRNNCSCADKTGDIWPLNDEPCDGIWREFKDELTLSN